MAGRVVVGVDGSPASLEALGWAQRQTTLTGADLEAVITWTAPVVYGGYPAIPEMNWEADSRSALAIAVKEALGEGADRVTQRVVEGHPVTALLEAAVGADLLVVGSRGHGGFAGMLLGSVSERVIAHAPCPVLVVRAERDAGAHEGHGKHERPAHTG